MTTTKIKEMLDACYLAKRIHDLMPPLPEGVAPSYIHIMDCIRRGEAEGHQVKVSEISSMLNLPRPGVTRTLKEMEQRGFIEKIHSTSDGRVVYITLTKTGLDISNTFDTKFFQDLLPYIQNISMEDADQMIATIETFYQAMLTAQKDWKEKRGTN